MFNNQLKIILTSHLVAVGTKSVDLLCTIYLQSCEGLDCSSSVGKVDLKGKNDFLRNKSLFS